MLAAVCWCAGVPVCRCAGVADQPRPIVMVLQPGGKSMTSDFLAFCGGPPRRSCFGGGPPPRLPGGPASPTGGA